MFDVGDLSDVTNWANAGMGLDESMTEESACGCWILGGHENDNEDERRMLPGLPQ